MTEAAQFWLPSLFGIDGQALGQLKDPVIPADFNVQPILSDLGIDRRFLEEFLQDASHALDALFLAGYKVPWVEIALQTITSTRIDEVNSAEIWLRIDLQNRRIEINRRPDSNQSNRIRLKILPIQTSERSFALDLGRSAIGRHLTEMPIATAEAQAVLQQTMLSFLTDALPAGDTLPNGFLLNHDDAVLTVSEYRTLQTAILGRAIETDGIAEMPLGFRLDHTAFDDPKAATRIIFKAFNHAIFDTITWITGFAIMDAARDANFDDSADGTNLPGLTWVLNPATWTALWPESRLIVDLPTTMGELQSVAERMFSYANSPEIMELTDPPASANPPQKRAGYLYGLIYGIGIDIAAEPAVAFPTWTGSRFDRVIDLILGQAARRSRSERRRSDRLKPSKAIVLENPYEKVSDSLEGLLHAMLLSVADDIDAGSAAAVIDNEMSLFFGAYRALISDFGDTQGLTSVSAATQIARQESYLTVVLSLFNLGVFSIDLIAGDMNADLEIAKVDVFEDTANARLHFKHSLYDLPGFFVWHGNPIAENLALKDLVAWEYVPAMPEPPANMRAALVAAGLFPEDNRDRLVVVAGPGIGIENLNNWPTQVIVEIYRVQSPALVPDLNERVNLSNITSPYVIGILDDITHVSGNNIVNDIDRRHEFQDLAISNPGILPFVTVTPVRKNGKCGVTVATTYPSNAYYRGIDGTAAVDILVNEDSPADRFAFDIRYEIVRLKRAIGTHHETQLVYQRGVDMAFERDVTIVDKDYVDVIQFQLIIKSTNGVIININDDKIGQIYDLFVTVLGGLLQDFADPINDTLQYEIWRTPTLAKIPVQGTPLTPGGNGFTTDPIPYQHQGNEAVVDHLKFMVDMTMGMVPVVGEATDVIELAYSLYSGTDKWGRPMTNFDRMLIVGGLAVPLVSRSTLQVFKGELPTQHLFKAVAGLN